MPISLYKISVLSRNEIIKELQNLYLMLFSSNFGFKASDRSLAAKRQNCHPNRRKKIKTQEFSFQRVSKVTV